MKFLPFLLSMLLAGCAAITPPPLGESIQRNLLYAHRPTGDLHLDIYHPASPQHPPVVIWFHGGGWKYGAKGWMLFIRKLTREGFAVASVQYRLSGTAKYPAQIVDCEEAFAWVRAHAEQEKLDGRNIFVAGASAGGQLAALVALEQGKRRVRAAALLYPPTDLTAFGNIDSHRGYLPPLLGGTVREKFALARQGSPVNYVHRDAPPFIIYHGAKDELVPVRQSRVFRDRLRADGVECRLIVLPDAVHNFALTDEQLREVGRFFSRNLVQ
jgi:acetyl esterase/lipase